MCSCSCCSCILCIQQTNSITWKGSKRDRVPSPLPLQTLSVEIITEPFNAVWWEVSQNKPQTSQAALANKSKLKTVTLKYCLTHNCLMESSKIENLIYVQRRLDQAGKQKCSEGHYFHFLLGENSLFSAAFGYIYIYIYKSPLVLLTSTLSSTLTTGIFRFDNYLSKLS